MKTLIITGIAFVLVLAYYLFKNILKKNPLQIWTKSNNLLTENNLESKIDELINSVNESYNKDKSGSNAHTEFVNILQTQKPPFLKLVEDVRVIILKPNASVLVQIPLQNFKKEIKSIANIYNGRHEHLVPAVIVPLELVYQIEVGAKKMQKDSVALTIKNFNDQLKTDLMENWKF